MVAKITEEVGHINILVNNAGIIKRIPHDRDDRCSGSVRSSMLT